LLSSCYLRKFLGLILLDFDPLNPQKSLIDKRVIVCYYVGNRMTCHCSGGRSLKIYCLRERAAYYGGFFSRFLTALRPDL